MKFRDVFKLFGSSSDMLDYRNKMLDEAEKLLDDGKMEEYQAKMSDIELFDKEYSEYTEEKANLEAMKAAVKVPAAVANAAAGEMMTAAHAAPQDNEKKYRIAFMNFVRTGEPIPRELRNEDEYTLTTDVTAVIPNTILNRIIERIEETGKILAKVTRTSYRGGVTVPTSAAKPVATWTSERGTTDKQNKTLGSITFNYYKLKCVVAISLETSVVTLEMFESLLVRQVSEAMTRALEKAVISGTGTGQPKGILAETAPKGQNIDIALAKDVTYNDLCSAEGALPSAYEGAEWAMTKKTYFNKIVGMTDANGQPIARTNVGIDGRPSYSILGRPVNFVSSENMEDYAESVTKDTVFAFMFRFEDYMLNTNMNITVKQYEDDDTDDKMTKAVMLVDGKVIDINSFVTLTKKKS